MDCKKIHIKLIPWIEGKANTSENLIIEKHLKECNSCNEFEKKLRNAFALMDSDKVTEKDPYMFIRIDEKLTKESNLSISVTLYKKILVAASLTGAVLIGGIIGNALNKNNKIYSDFETEKYFLRDIQQEDIELYLLSEQSK